MVNFVIQQSSVQDPTVHLIYNLYLATMDLTTNGTSANDTIFLIRHQYPDLT